MADGSPVVVVWKRTLLNPFLVFLQRLSLEIEEDQFQSMKFLVKDSIPLGILEKCVSPRDLFSRMQQKCILGEENLDLLEEMMITVERTDLAKRVKAFKNSRSEDEIVDATGEQMRSELPANGKALVYFSIAGKASEFKETATLDKMKHCLCEALAIKLSEISYVGRDENKEDSFFRVIFQIPKKESLLDTLCKEARCEKEWLGAFGITQVQVEGRAVILLSGLPATPSHSRQQVSKKNPSTSLQLQRGNSFPAMYRFQDEEKLDLIVIVECTLVNSTLVKRAKTQLLHLVDMIHNRGLNLQMALVSYKDHPRQKLFLSRLGNSPGQSAEKIAHCQGFTNEKDTMKTWIRELRGQGRGSTRGLADGLEVALKLVVGGSGGGVHEIKGRDDAIKICLLLPVLYGEAPSAYHCIHGNDVMKLCSLLAENAVTLYTVGIHQSRDSHLQGPSVNLISEFFEGISLKTGGRYIRTGNVKDLPEPPYIVWRRPGTRKLEPDCAVRFLDTKVVLKVGTAFCLAKLFQAAPDSMVKIALHVVEENASMERLIGTTNDIVMEEVRKRYGDVNIEQLTQKLQKSLNRRSCRSSQMQLNGVSFGPASDVAKKFSWDNSIADALETFERALENSRRTRAEAGIPLDVDSVDAGTGSLQVSILEHEEITTEVSERMVRKVAQRSAYFKPS